MDEEQLIMRANLKGTFEKVELYADIEKIVIAPQIVVYKNIFKFSQELIDLVEEDIPDSILDPWREWYHQGKRKGMFFNSKMDLHSGNELEIKEKKQNL